MRSNFLLDLFNNPYCVSVPGEKAFAYNKHRQMKNLPDEMPTRELIQAVAENNVSISNLYPILNEKFEVKTYSKMFTALLKIEEAYTMLTMRQYDMDCICFRKEDGYLVLDIPGLAEGRPSLMPGDIAVCYQAGISANTANPVIFEGIIHKTSLDSIFLKFESNFMSFYHYEPYNVCFKVSRAPIRRLHGALQDIDKDRFRGQILFPRSVQFKESMHQACDDIKWFNSRLNPQQRQAVKCILEGKCRPSPYIVMGPPGTGKTVTIVEAILQIFNRNPQSRILACSGSNAAADSIAFKLIASQRVTPKDMVRIIAFHRWESDLVPKRMMPYAQLCCEGNDANWLNHRIVVSTCMNATKFGIFKRNSRDFDYVFIDEASTVTEPESLLCVLLTSLQKQSLTVLVGDPHQLGPVVMSPFLTHLKTPLIERLCSLPPYERNEQEHDKSHFFYDPRCITKLIQSYRCCTELIHINSVCFYHSELKSEVKQDKKLLENFKNFPILFHGVIGNDQQMFDSPSWFNHNEAIAVVKFLDDLRRAKLKFSQVAIITPYRKQIQVIRSLVELTFKDKTKVLPEISTVEGFQGLEKKVVILSLVRSFDKSKTDHDQNHRIGFLNSPKRFNVATSRAKSFMIVVGNPLLLKNDPYWRQIIEYCCENNSYTGCPFETSTSGPLNDQKTQK